MSRVWIAWAGLGALVAATGCHRQTTEAGNKAPPNDAATAKKPRCNSDRIARILKRLDERPPLPDGFDHIPSELHTEGAQPQPHLVALSGPPAKQLTGTVIRVVRGGIYVVGDDDAVAPGGRRHVLAAREPLTYGDLQPLGEIAKPIALTKGAASVAIDADAPSSLAYVALESALAGGASPVRLLFELKDPTPPPPRPAGVAPESGGLEAVAAAFAKETTLRCPAAGKAFSEPIAGGDLERGVRALAAALPGCPCDIDMDVMEWTAYAATGGLPLTAVPVRLHASAGAGTDVEIPLDSPWSETANSLVEAAAKGPVHLVLPPAPPPPPPPPQPRKRR